MVKTEKNSAILASYVTLKELYNSNKYRSSYQILSEFIKYVIVNEKIHSFALIQIKEKINEAFGFNLPLAVLKTSIKSCDFITKVEKSNSYSVDFSKLEKNPEFDGIISEAEKINYTIIDDLVEFVKAREVDSYVDRQAVIDSLVAFLVEDYSLGKFGELVSEYVLINSDNGKVLDQLEAIKEGIILYIGLNYNVSETGSIRNDLTLYLDTEVLFNITGLNGELYQKVAADMLDVIAQANKKEQKIKLRYFDETRRDVEKFFDAASYVIENNTTSFVNRVAMDHILNGCSCATDVQDKLSDFFYDLKNKYNITLDDNDYYKKDTYAFNIEKGCTDDEEAQESIRLISHINKLRKGNISYEYTDCRYVLITETKKTLSISNSLIEKQDDESDRKACGYALTSSSITNFLWYKLNSGFGGKPYPHSIDAVLKARFVLSKEISKHVMESYENMRKEYCEGRITKEQVASRILGLRTKPMRPEDLNAENLTESLDFSEEFIREYEEKVYADKRLLEEKRREIEALNANHDFESKKQNQTIQEMKDIIAENNRQKESQQNTINELQAKVDSYEKEKALQAMHKRKIRALWKFILIISLKVLAIVIPFAALFIISKIFSWDIVQVISIVLGILGLIPLAISIFKNDVKKILFSWHGENK